MKNCVADIIFLLLENLNLSKNLNSHKHILTWVKVLPMLIICTYREGLGDTYVHDNRTKQSYL